MAALLPVIRILHHQRIPEHSIHIHDLPGTSPRIRIQQIRRFKEGCRSQHHILLPRRFTPLQGENRHLLYRHNLFPFPFRHLQFGVFTYGTFRQK